MLDDYYAAKTKSIPMNAAKCIRWEFAIELRAAKSAKINDGTQQMLAVVQQSAAFSVRINSGFSEENKCLSVHFLSLELERCW